jgi:hypothetical protein
MTFTPVSPSIPLPSPTDVGELGVFQLKRLWARAIAARRGHQNRDVDQAHRDQLVLDALGLGLEQAQQYLLREAPSFEAFEAWVVETAGLPTADQVARINAAIHGDDIPVATRAKLAAIDALPPVLNADDLAHWDEHGYLILHNAVPEEVRHAAEQAIWGHLGGRADDPDSWYIPNDHGIFVQFFQHPAFTAVRQCPRIHKAFAQLWGTADVWPATDRVGFNVPERHGWMFRGPHMHWDVSLARPIPFGTQGILYLTDTPAEQGAFTCVPGFHRRIDAWLDALPPGADPRMQDLHALGSKPIAGKAGDLVIWDHKLPHASSPNRGLRPRIVQYVNMYPTQREVRQEWR